MVAVVALMLSAALGRSQSNPSPLTAGAQASAASGVRIEVASVKPSDTASCGPYPMVGGLNDRVDMKCVRVSYLIQIAYGVRDFQIVGGPKWLGSEQYDIAAKITSSPDDNIAAQGRRRVN
jgi:uncharacterized protein (TIGR03435 family)